MNGRSGMSSRLLIATLTGAMVLALVPATVFAGTLDQAQEDTSTSQQWICGQDDVLGGCPLSEAQTFTAGISGLLDEVQLHVIRSEGSDPLTVEIRNTTNSGFPGTQVLATGSIADSATADWQSVDFDTMAIVEAGTHYAIVAYTGADSLWGWSFLYDDVDNPYDGGHRFTTESWPPTTGWDASGDADNAFRTYVSPSADLGLTMVGPTSVKKGATFTYLLEVDNDGLVPATNVVLTDNLPFGAQYVTATTSQGSCNVAGKKVRTVTCDLGSIAAGGSATVAITIKAAARAGSFINNIASLSGSTFDPDESNNTASVSTAITR